VVGKKPVTQIAYLGGTVNHLFVLCGGVVTMRSVDQLNEVAKVYNRGKVNQFCCLDGNPFYGICLSSKNKLILINLQQDMVKFSVSKTLIVPEAPKAIRWFKRTLCLGFRNEYSLMSYDGDNPTGLFGISGHNPYIELLPSEEIALLHKNTVVSILINKKKTRSITFQNQPLRYVLAFPFLVATTTGGLEFRNIVDPDYVHIIPQITDVNILISDGKDVIIANKNSIYFCIPNDNNYRVRDADLLVKVRSNPQDKTIFSRFVESFMSDPSNPFAKLLQEYIQLFKLKHDGKQELKIMKHI